MTDRQIYLVQGLIGLADLQELVEIDRPDLKLDPWFSVTHGRFRPDSAG